MKKLFQNKSLSKSIWIFLVCLVVLGGGAGSVKNVEAADNDILIYFTDSGSVMSHPPEIFKTDIEGLGYNVEIKTRASSGELGSSINLSNYSQVWIIDMCKGEYFTANEISAIENFRNVNCGGLLLSVDNFVCQERVNPVTAKFNNGVEIFYGSQKTGGNCISPSFTAHPLYSGLTKLSSTNSDACFNIQNADIEITATDKDLDALLDDGCDDDNDDDTYGAVLDEGGKGRIVFDSCMLRFARGSIILSDCSFGGSGAEEIKYQQNIAEWLAVCPPCPLPTCALTADPNSIDPEESSTLEWTTKNTDNADINGVAVDGADLPNGSKSVSPDLATSYKMTVVNTAGDTGSCSATVGVMIPPPCEKGLVPCGRRCDAPGNSYDESQPCTLCHLILMMQLIMDFLFKITAVVAALFIAAAGFMYIFATGRPEMLSLSKTTFKLTLLGFGLIFIAWILVDTILTMFGYIDPLGDGSWHIMC